MFIFLFVILNKLCHAHYHDWITRWRVWCNSLSWLECDGNANDYLNTFSFASGSGCLEKHYLVCIFPTPPTILKWQLIFLVSIPKFYYYYPNINPEFSFFLFLISNLREAIYVGCLFVLLLKNRQWCTIMNCFISNIQEKY